MNVKKALIIVSGGFPYGTPRALRMRAFAELFKSVGWDVLVYSDYFVGESEGAQYAQWNGMKLFSLGKEIPRIKKLGMPARFGRKICDIIEKENPSVIYSYSLFDRFPVILSTARKYRIPLVLDSNEWYDPSTFKHGRFSLNYIFHSVCWRWFYPKVDGVVAISRLLQKHYRRYGKHVMRIPTIVDEFGDWQKTVFHEDGKIRLLFAGSLSRTKDSIRQFYEAAEHLGAEKERVMFEICGVGEQEIREHLGETLYNQYEAQTNIRGWVSQDEIANIYMQCDYGIFFRPNQRSSHAGFSTKLGEGMSVGTPFIVNDTGDISLYIKDGKNGFIANDVSDIVRVFRQILSMSKEEKEEMRLQARRTAEKDFNYAAYSVRFERFLAAVERGTSHPL